MNNEIKTGDMPADEFLRNASKVSAWINDYLQGIEKYPVLSKINPGDIIASLPDEPPLNGEPFDEILKDLDKKILPGITHWNHPGFMAYFNSTSSSPGILAEFLIAALNVNGMLWRTGPASTELEILVLNWLRDMCGLNKSFQGIIYDTASVSSMHAIAAAREKAGFDIRTEGMSGRKDLPRFILYCSEFAHSSIEKGAITLGIGINGIRKIKTDEYFRMDVNELRKAVAEDKAKGYIPFCVVATVGTTSVTSIDPINDIGDLCNRYNIWLHVDAAYGGNSAVLPEMQWIMKGTEKADSIVINPHKWLFTPVDFSAFFIKDKDILKRAFSLIPEYLKTSNNGAENFMDYGIQLGRRFRSLKLWFIIRYFGVSGIQDRIRNNIFLAKKFEKWIDSNPRFVKMAPVHFATVCFRAVKEGMKLEELNVLNQRIMDQLNGEGKIFISHTKLNGFLVLRAVTSGLRMEERHVELLQSLLDKKYIEICQ